MNQRFDFDRRTSGVLMHPTSLPGRHGSGDLGAEARLFADFLHASSQTWWQMLPVNPPGDPPGNSPYSSCSCFAGSMYLIDLDELAEQGLLTTSEIAPVPGMQDQQVNFPVVRRFRESRLRKAFARFDNSPAPRQRALARFVEANKDWLEDYALFCAIKRHFKGKPWDEWDRDLRLRNPAALKRAGKLLDHEIRFHRFVQFVFERQWRALHRYCNDRGIGLIGDIPIFVAHDSADVWTHRDLFDLDRNGKPKSVSGYPPDTFNKKGQHWGHPHYNWAAHRRTRFAWWIRRFEGVMRLFDAVRIDHFLGFTRLWSIPAGAKSAAQGKWIAGPGAPLFSAVRKALGELPIIAEDLGLVTPAAERLREQFDFPGMRVMEFGFCGGSYHLPHGFSRRCVAYTGTHDNDTIVGYFDKVARAARKRHSPQARELSLARRYLNCNGHGIHNDFMRAAMSSVADTVIFPVQDIVGLDGAHRMNVPGTERDNWKWRLKPGLLDAGVAARLRTLTETYDRRQPSNH